MDEPAGGEIQRGNEYRVGPIGTGDIDATTLELVEELCRRFQLEAGTSRLELEFHSSRLQLAWRHERVQLGRLAEAYEPRG